MPNIRFITTGGGRFDIKDHDSARLGPALRLNTQVLSGTVFRPETGMDRDNLVAYLNSLDFTTRAVEVRLVFGGYQIQATKTMTQDQLDAWIEEERKQMAKRLVLTDPQLINITITEV